MLEPLTSLAFSVHSSKGIYALLLGSGLSSAAGIPTGWDIILDLIRKGAAASNEDCGPDPLGWYKTKAGQDADYSQLLDNVAKTSADRTNLLSGYFEPTAEEVEKGLKAPTPAHKAIARLVAKGYVRVIVTTNFDRLLERALESEGISPTVISTADGAHGALPLAHARCTVIKLHGDYRDTRIRNTAPELETYEAEMDDLLDRIFDEYGLIICGWSAAWDTALCRAVLRCPNRRFSTYWARRKQLNEEARALAAHRQAVELEIDSADTFFTSLETKLDAIERYSEPHPASAKLAVVSLKKFIAEDKNRIELRDLVATETERTSQTLSSLPVFVPGLTVEQLFERIKLYENASEILISLLTHGAFWGEGQHQGLWRDTVLRIAGISGYRQGSAQPDLLSLQLYPACLLFYSSCLGAIAGNKYETFKCLCRDTFVTDRGQRNLSGIVLPWYVLNISVARQLPGYNHWTPIQNRIFEILREPLREYLAGDSQYEDTFDRMEYLASLVHFDLQLAGSLLPYRAVGRFGWSSRQKNKSVEERISEEADKQGESWAVVQSGLFPSLSRFKEVEGEYRKETLSPARREWF